MNQQIIDYLNNGMKAGFTIDALKRELLKAGHQQQAIDEAVKQVTSEQSVAQGGESVAESSETHAYVQNTVAAAQSGDSATGVMGDVGATNMQGSESSEPQSQNNEVLGFVEKVNLAFTDPHVLFDKTRNEDLAPAIKYEAMLLGTMFALVFIFGIALAFFVELPGFLATIGIGLVAIVLAVIALVLVGLLLVIGLLGAAVLHLFVHLLKGKARYTETYKAVVYGNTPAILSVIPGIGIVFSIWGLVLAIIGLSKFHSISKMRAFFALFLPGLALGTLFIVLFVIAILLGIAGSM